MRFGMFYVLESPDNDHTRAYNEMFGQIEYAERLGFDSVWVAEHHGSHYGSMPSGAVAASAVARITSKMRIGIAVAILPFKESDPGSRRFRDGGCHQRRAPRCRAEQGGAPPRDEDLSGRAARLQFSRRDDLV